MGRCMVSIVESVRVRVRVLLLLLLLLVLLLLRRRNHPRWWLLHHSFSIRNPRNLPRNLGRNGKRTKLSGDMMVSWEISGGGGGGG